MKDRTKVLIKTMRNKAKKKINKTETKNSRSRFEEARTKETTCKYRDKIQKSKSYKH